MNPYSTLQSVIHLSTSVIAVVVLVNIWYNYYQIKVKSFHKTPKDYGLLFLCGALLVWALLSLLRLVNGAQPSDTLTGILSAVNNGFFMASFAYFKHGFEWFLTEKNRKNWNIIILVLTIVFVLIMSLLSINTGNDDVIMYLDFFYTSITALFLGGLLFRSFETRRLYAVAFVSMGVIFLAIFGQFLGLPYTNCNMSDEVSVCIFLISHSLMVAIFVSLAFSWVIENAEEIKEIKEDEIATAFLDRYGDNSEEVEKRLGDMLGEDQLYYVILIAKEFFRRKGQTKDRDKLDELSIISGNLTSLKVAERNGIINREQYNIDRTKIHLALLDVIEEISDKIKSKKVDSKPKAGKTTLKS